MDIVAAFKSMMQPEGERTVLPPRAPGLAPWPQGSKWPALRRQQLLDVADAYGLKVNRDAERPA